VARYHGLFIPSLPGKDMVGATYKSSSDVDPKSPFICQRVLMLRYFTEGLLAYELCYAVVYVAVLPVMAITISSYMAVLIA
jgi:hypothetical protein